jgi:hypothetical protein
MANPGNVAGGYKATISVGLVNNYSFVLYLLWPELQNPNTSEEAKDHAREVLEHIEQTGELPEPTRSSRDESEKNTGNIVG